MTKREAAIIELYTGICMLTGDDRKYVYAYARELMGRPILTHELSDEMLKEKSKADFIKLCKNLKKAEDSACWESCDRKRLEHGFIESIPNGGVCCSKCRRGFPKEYRRWKYCPDCGARMKQISLDTKRPANKSQPLKLKKQKKFSERKKDTTKRLPEQPKKFLAGRQP